MSNVSIRRLFYGLFLILVVSVIFLVKIETRMPVFFQGDSEDIGSKLIDSLQTNQFSRQYIIALENTSNDTSHIASQTHQLIKKLKKIDHVSQVWKSGEPPINIEQQLEYYAQRAPRLYSLHPEGEADQLFNVNRFPQQAAQLKQALLSPQAYLVKPVAKNDPLLLTFNAFKQWRNRFQVQTDTSISVAHVYLQSYPQAFDFEVQQQLQNEINDVLAKFNQSNGNQYLIKMTGVPIFAVAAQKEIKADVQKVTMLSSTAVVLVFLLLLRSFKALQWTLLILVSCIAMGTLLTTLVFGSTHALTIALGATLIGVCIDYPIHTMVHNAGADRAARLRAWDTVRRIWPSLLLGGLTTMIGYFALAFTGYPGFQQIAVFALCGIATALLLTRLVLPALLEKTVLRYPKIPGMWSWLSLCTRYKTGLRIFIALLFIVAITSIPRLLWLDDLEKLTGSSLQQLKKTDQSIRSQISTIEAGRVILIEADTLEQALQLSETVTLILQQLHTDGSLDNYYPIYPWLISQQLQQRNIEVYQQQVTPSTQKKWQKALLEQGLSVSKLGVLIFENDMMLDPERIMKSPAKLLIGPQVIQSNGQTLCVIWLGQHSPAKVADAVQGVKGVSYISQRDTINKMAQHYRTTAVKALSIGLLVIFSLLLLRYRKLQTALVTLLPALCAIGFIFGFWGLFRQPISFLHLIGSLLAIAICVDYGIFYSENRSNNQLLTYQAMGISMLTTLAAFASLSISTNPLLQTLSVAVSIGVVIGFLLCPIFIGTDNQANEYKN